MLMWIAVKWKIPAHANAMIIVKNEIECALCCYYICCTNLPLRLLMINDIVVGNEMPNINLWF